MNTIKIAVAGLGRIGKIHMKNLCSDTIDAEVIGAMDKDASAEAIANKAGVDFFSTEFDKLLKLPGLDAVAICSPTDTHADYIIRETDLL